MGTLLLILGIIGAIPGLVNFAKMLWELIKQIRDKKAKRAAKKAFVACVFDAIRHDKTLDQVKCANAFAVLHQSVLETLVAESKEHHEQVMASLGADMGAIA